MNYRRARIIAFFICMLIALWMILTNNTAHGYLIYVFMACYFLLEGVVRRR
jgi:hypothetical protein